MLQSIPEAGLELGGLGGGLAPGGSEHLVAVLFQVALAFCVVGSGQQLVVGVAAVGFEDQALGGPQEVGLIAEQRLVGERLWEVGEEGVDEVLELVARGRAGGDDVSELLCAPVVGGDELVGLDEPKLRASLTARRSVAYGSIEERSISVRSGGVTGMPLWNVRSMHWLRCTRIPSRVLSAGTVTSGSR